MIKGATSAFDTMPLLSSVYLHITRYAARRIGARLWSAGMGR
jgi:hypothetical protein